MIGGKTEETLDNMLRSHINKVRVCMLAFLTVFVGQPDGGSAVGRNM